MGQTINSVTGKAAPIFTADQAAAIIRTSLTKSGSAKMMKAHTTSDSRFVDQVRGAKFSINSLVMVKGIVSVDTNVPNSPVRLDRVKLFAQAVNNIMSEKNGVVNKQTLTLEMNRLYSIYKNDPDFKQPDSEQFDKFIANLTSQECADTYRDPIRSITKAGDFSVSDLEFTLVDSSCGRVDDAQINFTSDEAVAEVKSMMGVSAAAARNIAGGNTATEPKKRSSKGSKNKA